MTFQIHNLHDMILKDTDEENPIWNMTSGMQPMHQERKFYLAGKSDPDLVRY